jgi:hypothetical protein
MHVENPTHFDDWLRRFEISLLCTAPKICKKVRSMLLATKLSTDNFAEFRNVVFLKTLQTTVTKRQRQGSVFSSVRKTPYLPTVTTACVLLGTKGKCSRT